MECCLALACVAALALQGNGVEPRSPTTPAATEAWEPLAKAYEDAFFAWVHEMTSTGAWEKPESERPPSPAAAFRPRFEAFADDNPAEARALLWLLANDVGAPEEAAARAARDLERLARTADANGLGDALGVLAGNARRFDRTALTGYLVSVEEAEHADTVRAHALLAHAVLLAGDDAAAAADLRRRAAMLRWRSVELQRGEALEPEERDELARALLDGLDEARSTHFQAAYHQGDDGTWYPNAAAPADPRELWQPVIELLGNEGALKARAWLLFETWPRDDAEKERHRGHLEALAQAELDEGTLSELAWRADTLVQSLGADHVEPRLRAIAERAPEALRAGLFFGLGVGLCSSGEEGALRERGLALLREVRERWPDSHEAERAAGKLFRFENLVIGKKVPDFEATDADGNTFNLSDYEGKVTVIDFWGFW